MLRHDRPDEVPGRTVDPVKLVSSFDLVQLSSPLAGTSLGSDLETGYRYACLCLMTICLFGGLLRSHA